MRVYFFILTLFFSVAINAAPLNFDFKSISVADLTRLAFVEVLKVPFVIAPEVLSDSRILTLSIIGADRQASFDSIRNILLGLDVTLEDRNGVFFAFKKSAPSQTFSPFPVSSPLPAPSVASQSATFMPSSAAVANPLRSASKVFNFAPHHRSPSYLAPVAQLAGAQVLKDNDTGSSLFFSCAESDYALVSKALLSADLPIQTFTIKVTLIEFTQSSDDQFSFGLDLISKRLNAAFHPVANLTNTLLYKGVNLSAILSATHGDSRFNYQAQPQVLVSDGQTATLSVGQDVPVLGSSSFSANGTPIQSITYRNSGVMLKVSPVVVGDSVQITVEQENSSFMPTTSSTINSPTLSKRSIKTSFLHRPGDSILMAGITEERENNTRTGLSFLPDFLQSTSKQKTRVQVLLHLEILPN